MKRIAICIVLALAPLLAVAQKSLTPGVRYETTEITVNDDSYSLFMYSDRGDTVGYYLGLGHAEQLLGVSYGGGSSFSLGTFDEVCLFLGFSTEEAYASLDTLIALFDLEVGTEISLPARLAPKSLHLGDFTTAVCTVEKPLLSGKRLVFAFDHSRYQVRTYLSRSSVKQLRSGLKFYKKLHPDKR